MLRVGRHNNVQLYKATKNDKGTLVLGFKKHEDPLASLNSSSDDSAGGGDEQDILILSPYATNYEGNVDTADNNMNKIKEIKDVLTHLLLGYTTADKIKWDTNKGLGITRENINEKMTQQPVLDAMYANIVNQFIEMITPFLVSEERFRLLFIRQSRAKHFPALRRRYLGENPFWESMTVPEEQSRVKFTQWEIDNKYNSSERVEQTTADPVDSTSAAVVHDVLND